MTVAPLWFMRKARPSTQAIVRSENAIWFATAPRMRKYMPTDTRSTMAEAMVASAHAVPAAASQFKLKIAAYGAGAVTRGGRR